MKTHSELPQRLSRVPCRTVRVSSPQFVWISVLCEGARNQRLKHQPYPYGVQVEYRFMPCRDIETTEKWGRTSLVESLVHRRKIWGMTGQVRQFSAENGFGVMTDANICILISTRPLENELQKSEKGMCPSHRYRPDYHLTNPAIMVWHTKSNICRWICCSLCPGYLWNQVYCHTLSSNVVPLKN